jgi:hypothetical protein
LPDNSLGYPLLKNCIADQFDKLRLLIVNFLQCIGPADSYECTGIQIFCLALGLDPGCGKRVLVLAEMYRGFDYGSVWNQSAHLVGGTQYHILEDAVALLGFQAPAPGPRAQAVQGAQHNGTAGFRHPTQFGYRQLGIVNELKCGH